MILTIQKKILKGFLSLLLLNSIKKILSKKGLPKDFTILPHGFQADRPTDVEPLAYRGSRG